MEGTLATPPRKQAAPRTTIVKQHVQRSIAARSGEVVLRRELAGFGSAAQLSRALKRLVTEGRLQIGKRVVTDENDLKRSKLCRPTEPSPMVANL